MSVGCRDFQISSRGEKVSWISQRQGQRFGRSRAAAVVGVMMIALVAAACGSSGSHNATADDGEADGRHRSPYWFIRYGSGDPGRSELQADGQPGGDLLHRRGRGAHPARKRHPGQGGHLAHPGADHQGPVHPHRRLRQRPRRSGRLQHQVRLLRLHVRRPGGRVGQLAKRVHHLRRGRSRVRRAQPVKRERDADQLPGQRRRR